jgi:hypothetical protein
MSEATYVLCTLTSIVSAALLARAAHGPSGRLMFWGAIFFVGMALNNVLLFVDALLGPSIDWSLWPNLVALISIAILLYALIWETT